MKTVTFSVALDAMKVGKHAQRLVVKNETVLIVHKKRMYHFDKNTGVRFKYTPSDADLMANDYVIF